MTLRAVLFDTYGTLLEVGPPPPDADARWQRLFRDMLHAEPHLSRLDFAVACNKVIARHHEAARARGIPWPEVHWPSIVAEVVPELARLSRGDQHEFLYRQIQTGHTTHLNSETADMLRWLKERPCLLGIISNAQAYTLREVQEALATHGLDRSLFERDLCFWSFEHGFSKPDPHVFQILTARLQARGITPDQTLMVGDCLDNDIEPAEAHGWRVWHYTADDQPSGPGGSWHQLRGSLQRPASASPDLRVH
jgi:putative hydrolase of the HAD superfamily